MLRLEVKGFGLFAGGFDEHQVFQTETEYRLEQCRGEAAL
jgi:hypothetical protein